MATKSYKCPSCGAGIHFKPDYQKFKCDYCFSEFSEAELTEYYKKNKKPREKPKVDKEKLLGYHCKSCGAEVVTEDTTTSTFCYYCHNPVIISDRLKDEFLPNKLIPFTISKDKAKEKFIDWAGKKKFVPPDFLSTSHLEKITGVYLPYWWVDCKANIDYQGEGRNVNIWTDGRREYRQTKKFNLVRQGVIDINNVGELAFTKIDKNLLNGIGPYREDETIPFSTGYLSGFFAEQYDLDKDQVKPIIENQVNRYSEQLLRESITGYDQINNIKNEVHVNLEKWHYTLLPAWLLTYNYYGKIYIYAVNGQTGRSFGELPLNNKKLISFSGIIFFIVFILLLLGGRLIW